MKVLDLGSACVSVIDAFKDADITRVDVDPDVKPNILCDIRELRSLNGEHFGQYDVVCCSHILEHLYDFELKGVIESAYDLLTPDGILFVRVPDILEALRTIVTNDENLDSVLYTCPMGGITAIHMIYGEINRVEAGKEAWAHKTGFDKDRLRRLLLSVFPKLYIRGVGFDIAAVAYKTEVPKDIYKYFNLGAVQ